MTVARLPEPEICIQKRPIRAIERRGIVMPETNRRKPMLPVEGLLLWESAKRNSAKRDPFEDPLERPEWQPLFPWLRRAGLLKD